MSSVKDLEPYKRNFQGLVDVLIDFKSTNPSPIAFKITGFRAECFESITQGDAVFCRASDGKIGKAIANDTFDKATVCGISEVTGAAGTEIRVITAGQVAVSQTLDAGDTFFLSPTTPGLLTKTVPTSPGQYVVRVGEAANTTQLIVRIKQPFLLNTI